MPCNTSAYEKFALPSAHLEKVNACFVTNKVVSVLALALGLHSQDHGVGHFTKNSGSLSPTPFILLHTHTTQALPMTEKQGKMVTQGFLFVLIVCLSRSQARTPLQFCTELYFSLP